MSFDEPPDGPLHGECAAEIHRLKAERDSLAALVKEMREALEFYAEQGHFMIADESAWDTVSGEPPNFWCDEAETATMEDGSVASAALAKADELLKGLEKEHG